MRHDYGDLQWTWQALSNDGPDQSRSPRLAASPRLGGLARAGWPHQRPSIVCGGAAADPLQHFHLVLVAA